MRGCARAPQLSRGVRLTRDDRERHMEEATSSIQQDLAGVRLYTPGVIAMYTVLSLPVGLYVYGLNIYRRGRRLTGGLLGTLGALMFCAMLFAGATGHRISGFGILGIFVALGLFKIEAGRYKSAVARGASAARWWPPLLLAVAAILVVAILGILVAPEQVVE